MTVTRRPSQSQSRENSLSKTFQLFAPILAIGFCLVVVLYGVSRPEQEEVVILLGAAAPNGVAQTGPVVQTSNGKILGKILQSRDGRNYSAFYHIPYAEPPVREYRFQAPRPYNTSWEGIRDGTQRGDAETECIQFKGNAVSGVEDCLYLSVFSPKLPRRGRRNPKLPVMVYIFGGAYLFGRTGRYGAEYIMDEDVVLVLVDFRVGSFGHLNTEDGEIRGNQAFKDQIMALKWVQKEIKKFGGDTKRVLVFGNSSGAASIHALMLSSMSKGLFSRAVSQSGTVVLPPGQVTKPLESAKQLGRALNCSNVDDTSQLHRCLIQADPRDIAGVKLDDMLFVSKDSIPPQEVASGDLSQVFLTDYAYNLLKGGNFNPDIPWLVGANSAEAYMMSNTLLMFPALTKQLNTIWDVVAPPLLKFTDDPDHNASSSIRQFYFGTKEINNDTRQNLTNLVSDPEWIHPITVAARYHAHYGGKAYFYWLTREPVQSYAELAKYSFKPPFGVHHADEVQYFFPFDPFPYMSKEHRDYKFSKKMIRQWVQFARTGRPDRRRWSPLEKDGKNSMWMELADEFKPMAPLQDRIEFLDNFPFDYPNFQQ